MASRVASSRLRVKSSWARTVSRSMESPLRKAYVGARAFSRRANAGTNLTMNVLLHLAPEMSDRVFDPADLARLSKSNTLMNRDQLSRLQEAEILITGWGTPTLDDAFLDRAKKL